MRAGGGEMCTAPSPCRQSCAEASLSLVLSTTEVVSLSSLPFAVNEVIFFLALLWACAVTALAINVGWRSVYVFHDRSAPTRSDHALHLSTT